MMNKILTAANARLLITNLFGVGKLKPTDTLDGLPLGTVGNSTTGEVVLKVSIREGASSGGDASAANQTTGNASLASIDGKINGTVTPHFTLLTAGTNQIIPINAKGWSVTILTGTGTIGGLAVPAGFSDSDTNKLAATVTIATDTPGTAYVRWNT